MDEQAFYQWLGTKLGAIESSIGKLQGQMKILLLIAGACLAANAGITIWNIGQSATAKAADVAQAENDR